MRDPREWTAADAARYLHMPTAASDKYSRGVVGVRTGSAEYPGAAVLGVEGAWAAGAGMVRYAGPARAEVIARRPETVLGVGRVQCWVIGSGTVAASRAREEERALVELLDGDAPVIVDAGALDLVGSAAEPGRRAPVVVTPHAGEYARLRERLGAGREGGADDGVDADADAADTPASVARTAALLRGTVLLKGARTLVASADGDVLSVRAGTPWLATAGTGDVLAGIIGAIVAADGAQAPDAAAPGLARLAATGAWIHGAAGRVAAGQLDPEAAATAADLDVCEGLGHPITALAVAHAVPRVIGALLRIHGTEMLRP